MKLSLSAKTVLFAAVCFAVINSSAYAKTMYKWVDEKGKVSFSDQVPPDKASLGHKELDKNAKVVKVAEKAKTGAEREIEKRLALLRKKQEEIIVKQKGHDKKLLSNYITVDALDATKKSKMQALARQQWEIQETIKKLEGELTEKRKEAASFEIKNTKVPKEVLDQIEDNQKKTIKSKQDLNELQLKVAATEREFAVDRARYLFLTKSKASAASKDTEKVEVSQPGLFSCDDAVQCEKAWSIAKDFVKTNSVAKIAIDSETLFMSEEPVSDTDLNLSISKMAGEGNKTEIFLDIRCANTAAANALCISPKAEDIRIRFNDYIKENLSTSAAPAPVAAPTPAAPKATPAPAAVAPAAAPAPKAAAVPAKK